jgi:peptide/nickel transport system substrate-binding protein
MNRRLWLSATAAVVGTTMIVFAAFAGAAASKQNRAAAKGGTLRLNMSGTDVDFSDPSLAYGTISWQVEYATALKLYNYPDKPKPLGGKIQPEGAIGFPVISKDGKTYTITVKSGYRFSDGKPVTAKNYVFAINRALSKTMQSPAAAFIDTTNAGGKQTGGIVGANAVLTGTKNTASGVTARGNKIVIKLLKPDGGLLAKLGMPFFQALETNLPLDPKGVSAYPSAGPYYIASRDIGRQLTLKRNKFYKGSRPANADEMDITVNTNLDQSLLQVKANQVDYDMGGLPASANAELGSQYGVNKPNGQYHVNQLVETDYVALNTSRAPFSNVGLRKAANYAIDRRAMLTVRGKYAGQRTDQILPPGMGGFRNAHIYPIAGADYAKASSLAKASGQKCGDIKLVTSSTGVGPALAQVFAYNMENSGHTSLGCNVTVVPKQGFQVYVYTGQKGADFDAAVVGWNQDYPDPYDFLDILLNGNNIHDNNNNNLAYFNNPGINARLAAANKLVGDARYNTYGQLDIDITRNFAPWASYDNRNEREFTAPRIGGYLFQPANASADLNTLFIK